MYSSSDRDFNAESRACVRGRCVNRAAMPALGRVDFPHPRRVSFFLRRTGSLAQLFALSSRSHWTHARKERPAALSSRGRSSSASPPRKPVRVSVPKRVHISITAQRRKSRSLVPRACLLPGRPLRSRVGGQGGFGRGPSLSFQLAPRSPCLRDP